MTLTLGISPCPNDVFLFSGLLLGAAGYGAYRLYVRHLDKLEEELE